MTVDTHTLDLIANATEIGPYFNIGFWRHCAIGQYCARYANDALQMDLGPFGGDPYPLMRERMVGGMRAVQCRLGLSEYIVHWLFTSHTAQSPAAIDRDSVVHRLRVTADYYRRKQAAIDEHERLMSLPKRDRWAILLNTELTTAS
jgi:hypothetical protein